jgi:hypothetical protein
LTSGAIGSGFTTVATAQGGTGQTTYANGELLIGKTDGTLAKATLSGGTGIDITNADGAVTVDVDSTVVTTAQTGTVTSTMIADGTIVDADVNASAAIAGTKISPNFGSQNVLTTGTATAASLNPTGSTVPANGVYLPEANEVGISTDGSNRLHIDSTGNVGIGTTSPGSALEINAAAATSPFIAKINTAEAARIDSSGRLLVGTSTALSFASPASTVNIQSFSANPNGFAIVSSTSNVTANAGSSLVLARRASGGPVAASLLVGSVQYQGFDGTNYLNCASIEAFVDGIPGANDMPGRLVFSTTADGASSPTERMRIDGSGNFFLNTTTVSPGRNNTSPGFFVEFGTNLLCLSRNTGSEALCLNKNENSNAASFRRSGTEVGSISVTTTATAYNTSSDYRLKENVVPLSGAIDRLQQIPVHRFNFIADPDTVVDGFIAHEAQAIVPECVTGTKDEVDEDGNPVYQGIDQSKLVPLLMAALQEAIAEIASLKDRVAALEAS